jgi:hypothetical protein
MKSRPTRAVITGDIVNYTKIPPEDQEKLIKGLSLLAAPNRIEFYRGDSFQLYLEHPGEALRLVLQLRTFAQSMYQVTMMPETDIRASLGIGSVNEPVKTINTSSGDAFTISGRNFDNMDKSDQRLIIQAEILSANAALRLIAYFSDYLMEKLTSRQAAVVFERLNNQTQIEAARKLNKSQATVNQHLQAAGWTAIEKLLDEYVQITLQFE